MSFHLQITFTGLCLFVPRKEEGKLHVLMPRTDRLRHHGSAEHECSIPDEHAMRLVFDTAHLTKGSTAPSKLLTQVSLKEKILEIPRWGDLMPDIPPGLVKLDGTLKEGVLEDGVNLTSRVTLHSGSVTDAAEGECFQWRGGFRRMSHILDWTIEDHPGSFFVGELRQMNGGSGGTLPTLYPISIGGKNMIQLTIFHVTPGDLPPDPIKIPDPKDSEDVHHFAAYYEIADVRQKDLPKVYRNKCGTPSPKGGRGGNPFRCMNAIL